MSKLSFLNNVSTREAASIGKKTMDVNEEMMAYDTGQTEIIDSPEVNVRRMPSQITRPTKEGPSAGQDDKYGFVEKDVFDPIDTMEGYETPVVHDPMQASRDAAILEERASSNYNILGITEHHDPATRAAARDSQIGYVDYSSVGKLWRSVIAGVGSQIFSAGGDVIDWLDGVQHMVLGEEETGRSIYDEKDPEGTPYERRESFKLHHATSPYAVFNVYKYFTGIDPIQSFTDTLRKAGNALETIDDKVEEQFKDEHGEEFIKKDEEGNIKVDYAQLLIPDFWLTKVAKQIPNMVMFAYTGGGGAALSAKGYQTMRATKVGQSAAKSYLGKKAVEVGTKTFGSKFTGDKVARFFGAGIGANMSEGAVLAGEAYKQALEDGLSKDQAATVGLRVIRDNSYYMVVDAMQYAVFTKGIGAIPRSLKAASRLKLGTGVTFKTAMTELFVGSGLAVTSGKMEEFQEIYQDWRIKTNLAQMKGEEFMSYTDYYRSPEVAETRLVSFGMGFATGGFGVIRSTINDAAVASGVIDEKIEGSGMQEGGEGLLFIDAATRIKKQGTKGGEFTAEEVAINKKHIAIENAILNSVVDGTTILGKERIEKLVEDGQMTREEGDAAILLTDEMAEAYKPFQNENMKGMPVQHRKEAARLAYRISMENKLMNEAIESYDSKIEAIKNDETREDSQKQEEINIIEREKELARKASMETMAGYHKGIKQVKTDALAYLQKKSDEIDAKNKASREEFAKEKTEQAVSEQEIQEAEKQKVKIEKSKQRPSQRQKRINEINKTIESLVKEDKSLAQSDIQEDFVRREDIAKQLKQLRAERESINEVAKEDAEKKSKANKVVKEKREAENKKKKRGRPKKKPDSNDGTMFQVGEDVEDKSKPKTLKKIDDNLKHYKVVVDGEVIGDRHYGVEEIYRQRLKEKGVNLIVFSHFSKSKNGLRFWGAAQGLSIYLNANKATQETYFHELAHVYLMELWDTAPVKALRKIVIGSPVFNQVKTKYMSQLVFKNKKGQLVKFENIVKQDGYLVKSDWLEKNPGKTKSDYIEYVANKAKKQGIEILPDDQQRAINEEAVVEVMAKSADNQDLNGLIDVSKKSRWKNNMKKVWGMAKKPFTKEDQKEIFEKTGNEELVDKKDVLDTVMKDYKQQALGKEGVFEFRREREGFSGKMMHNGNDPIIDGDTFVQNQFKDLYTKAWKNDKFNLELDVNGEPTVQSMERYKGWVIETLPVISEQMKALHYGENGKGKIEEFTDTRWENFKKNKRKLLNSVILGKLGSYGRRSLKEGVDLTLDEQIEQENFLEAYLPTRNKENETLTNWIKTFSRLAPEIRGGGRDIQGVVRKTIWKMIHTTNGLSTKQDFEYQIRELQKKWKKNKGADMSVEQEIAVRYINYVEQLYKTNGWAHQNALAEMHHDISSYKRISWTSYHVNKDGNVTLQPHKGVQMIIGEKYAQAEQSRKKEMSEIFQKRFKSQKAFLDYLTDVVKLESLLKKASGDRQKRLTAASFIYKHFVVGDVKDTISPEDLVSTDAVTDIITDNAAQLIQDTALFRVPNITGFKNKFNKKLPIDLKTKLRPLAVKSAERGSRYGKIDFYENERTGKIEGIQRGDAIANIETLSKHPSLNSIAKSIVAAQSAAKFDSMIRMPGGEKTANVAKQHQIDILTSKMAEMSNTRVGRQRLRELFPNNPIVQKMVNLDSSKRIMPVIKQVIGGNMYNQGETPKRFNAGENTSNEMTDMQISLINDAISKRKKTYSQSISIFSDKKIELHLNNAELYSLNDARKEAEKLFGRNTINKLIQDIDAYLGESNLFSIKNLSKEAKEQIALNYAINKYYAKDLFIGPARYFKDDKDYAKRAAGSVAMHVGLGSDVRVEPIMLKDVLKEITITDRNGKKKKIKINRTDASSFILPEDSEMVTSKYGRVRNVGKHYKFVYYGQNLDNTTLESQVGTRHPFYGKTNTFVLTDQFVEDNPNFASLKKALEIRKEATLGSSKTVMPMIMFESAIKVLSPKEKGKYPSKSLGAKLISVDKLNELNKDGGVGLNKHQDGLFAFENNDGEIDFGLDGSFIGIQTELDKSGNDASLSKQLTFMMSSNPELLEEVNSIMQSLVDAFTGKKNSTFKKFGGDIKSIIKNVYEVVDRDVYDDSAIDLLKEGSLDSGTLSILKGIIRSNVIKGAIKMRGPGGIGVQSTDFAMGENISLDNVSESSGLKHYVRDEEGNVIRDDNNLENDGLAEVVLDSSVALGKGLKVGDVIIIQRIPTSKMGDGVVCRVKAVTEGMGTMIQISSETSSILGSDLDGDALHVVTEHKGENLKGAKQAWNDSFNKMESFLRDGRNEAYTESGINELDSFLEELDIKSPDLNDLSLLDNRDLHASNIGSGDMIGRAATFNNGHKILSAGNAKGAELNLKVNGKVVGRSYKDSGNSWLDLAYVLNMFLDNANKGHASNINLNEHTFNTYTELISRGVPLKGVVEIMNSPLMREIVKGAQISGDTVVNSAREMYVETTGGFFLPNSKFMSKKININSSSDIFDYTALLVKTNERNAIRELDSIRNLASLDTRLPETTAEGIEMIDSILNLASGRRKEKEEFGFSKVDVSEIVSVAEGVGLQTLKQKLFLGDINFLKKNIVFNNPLLANHFDTLLKSVEGQRKMDPAYTGGYYQLVNKIFPLQTLFDSQLAFGMTKNQRIESIRNIEDTIRSVRLMQSDVYKNINPTTILTNLMGGETINESSPESVKEAVKETEVHDLPLVQTFHNTIKYLNSVQNGENFEFLSRFLRIKKVEDRFRKGYLVPGKDATKIKIEDGSLKSEGLERKYTEEYTIGLNNDALKGVSRETIENSFKNLPKEVQEFLYLYDLVMNNHSGPNSLKPYLFGDMRSKITKETQGQLGDIKGGLITKASLEKMEIDVMINNKESIVDISKILNIKRITNLEWAQKMLKPTDIIELSVVDINKGIPINSVVRLNIKTKNNKDAFVLYRTGSYYNNKLKETIYTLTPVDESFATDKVIPSREVPVRDDRFDTTMYMMGDDVVESTSTYKSLGKTKDGQDIIDSDGRFGSTTMFMFEEEESHIYNKSRLDYADYARIRYDNIDHTKLSPKDKKKLDADYAKYLSDLDDVKRLEEMYFKQDNLGKRGIEASHYTIADIYKIIKKKVNPLDEVAARNLYNGLVKAIAVKAAIKSLDTILENNPGLTAEEIEKIKKDKKKIRAGSKSFKDISYGDMWMGPDVSDTQRQEIAHMLREIEEQESLYRRELSILQKKTNKAYENLIKERFKDSIIPWWLAKFAYEAIPYVRHFKMMNKHIFGNLIRENETFDKDTKQYYRILEMKDFLTDGKVDINKMKEAGLTKAEQEYYKMFIEMTGDFADHMYNKVGVDGQRILSDKRKKVYIPNKAGSQLETMLARNMTAMFIGFNYDSSLRGIYVNGVDPVSGESFSGKDAKTLGWFINQYMIAQSNKGLSVSDFKMKNEVKRLQEQAKRYLETGKDAKGLNAIKIEQVENLGEGENFNRYLSARSNKAQFLGSYDIHSSLNQYIEKNFFAHGLESKGFSFTGAMDLKPLIDGVISYSSFKDNPNARKWVQELWKDKWLFQEPKKSLIAKKGEKHWADTTAKHLMKWTMFVGLALKPAVAVGNVAIGKYNEYRRSGLWNMARGEKLFWGEMYKSKGDARKNKVFGISDYFGLLVNSTQQTSEGFWTGPIGNIMFWFMTASESYIQRTAFAAQLSPEQWNSFKMEGDELVVVKGQEDVFETIKENASEMKDNVYSVQGRGYTVTDQRLIQTYFIIDGLLQFKRWFPTFIMDRLGDEKIDRFGRKQIGSLRALLWDGKDGGFLRDMWMDGNFDIRTWMGKDGEFSKMPKHRQEAAMRAIRGGKGALFVLALLAMGGAFDDDDDESFVMGRMKHLFADIFLLGNVKKLHHMAAPPMLQTGKNITNGFSHLLTNAKYSRETKYFEKGDPKYKGDFIKLMPKFIKDLRAKN